MAPENGEQLATTPINRRSRSRSASSCTLSLWNWAARNRLRGRGRFCDHRRRKEANDNRRKNCEPYPAIHCGLKHVFLSLSSRSHTIWNCPRYGKSGTAQRVGSSTGLAADAIMVGTNKQATKPNTTAYHTDRLIQFLRIRLSPLLCETTRYFPAINTGHR